MPIQQGIKCCHNVITLTRFYHFKCSASGEIKSKKIFLCYSWNRHTDRHTQSALPYPSCGYASRHRNKETGGVKQDVIVTDSSGIGRISTWGDAMLSFLIFYGEGNYGEGISIPKL